MLRGKRVALLVAVCIAALPLGATTVTGAATTATTTPCTWNRITYAPALAGSDTHAYYWGTPVQADPTVSLTITGTYPASRYASIQAYTLPGGFLAGFVDKDFPPDAGSTNPFDGGARRGHGTYTLHVVFGPPPPTPDASTLYLDEPAGTTLSLIYRIYLPDALKGVQGGVALPVVTARSIADGTPVSCPQPGAAAQRQSLRAPVDPAAPRPSLRAPARPARLAAATSSAGPTFTRLGPPLPFGYSNHDAAYLTAVLIPSATLPLYVIRFKVPTTPHTLWTFGGQLDPNAQLRYLSLCAYYVTDTPYKCFADEQLSTDATGQATVVLGATWARPTNAAAPGVTWLSLNWFTLPYLVILRNMLPAPSYAPLSIFNVPYGGGPSSMGPYAPTITQCATVQFEQNECPGVSASMPAGGR